MLHRRRLQRIEGVDEVKAQRLVDKFGTYDDIRNTSIHELQEVHGIGPILARRINPPEGLVPGDLDA